MTHLLSFVFSHEKWFVIRSGRLFLYWTHSYMLHYLLVDHPLFILLVGDYFSHFLSCQTTYRLLLYNWYKNDLTYEFLNHSNSTFFIFLCLCKTCFILFILLATSILFLFCVLLLSLFFTYLNLSLHIISTASWSFPGYW